MTLEDRYKAVNDRQDEIERHGNRMAALGMMIGILLGFLAAGLLIMS